MLVSSRPPEFDQPALAIVANVQTPYRLHMHRRFAAEIPELRLWSIYHGRVAYSPDSAVDERIGPVPMGQELIRQRRFPIQWLIDWVVGGRVIRWLKAHPGVRAVMVLGYMGGARLRVLRWCLRRRIPVLVWGDSNIRGDRTNGVAALVKRLALPRLLRRCDACLCCGRLGREFFIRYGADPSHVFVSPCEPDYRLIEELPLHAVEAAKRRFGLKGGRRRIVYSGRLSVEKRVDLLIDAFARVAPQRPQWDLVIVGGGPLEANLKCRASETVKSRITWTGFLNDQAAISAIYRASDVLVLPSDFEPWAVVINEAVAARMAVVASDVVGAAAELVRDRENGRIFSAGDVNALADCLLDVTDEKNTERYKAASAPILADWRRVGDPVLGLRQALVACGALPIAQSRVRDSYGGLSAPSPGNPGEGRVEAHP